MGPLFGDRTQSARLYRFVSGFYDTFRPLFAGFPATREAYYRYRDLGPDDRVLDLGCGTGESTREIVGADRDVHGLDLSTSQVGMTNRKSDLDSASFVVGDAMTLPYQDDVYDLVSSVGSLQHVPDVPAALSEAHRVTVSGGQLFVVGPKRPESTVGGTIADALMHFMRPAEMERLAREAGWSDVETQMVHMEYLARDAVIVTGTA